MKNTFINKLLYSPIAYTYYLLMLLILPWCWLTGLLVFSVGILISIGDGLMEFKLNLIFLREFFIAGIVNPILWHRNYWKDFDCGNMVE